MEIVSKVNPSEQQTGAEKLSKRIIPLVGKYISDFKMISYGDRVMVCIPGGKDNCGLSDVLIKLQKKTTIRFHLLAINLAQGQPGFSPEILETLFKSLKVKLHIRCQDTFSVVKRLVPKEETICSSFFRLRREAIYCIARVLDVTKIALGNYKKDILETFLLNLSFSGSINTTSSKFFSYNKKHIVIRSLSYFRKRDLFVLASLKKFIIIPCNLSGSQKNLKRQKIKNIIAVWGKSYENRIDSIFNALSNIIPSHLLDKKILTLSINKFYEFYI